MLSSFLCPRPSPCFLNQISLFRSVGKGVKKIGLGHFEDTKSPVILAALGGLCISTIGVLVPPSMFWAEFEMKSIAEPGRALPHIWPQVSKIKYVIEANDARTRGQQMVVGKDRPVRLSVQREQGYPDRMFDNGVV